MRIIADSSCDLYSLDYQDFKTVPLTIYTKERSFIDDENLNITEMLDYLASYKDRSYTSCPSIDAFKEAFEGADEIFVMTITSALSGSYNSALNAAQMYKDEHPLAKIAVFDSLSTGAEEILALQKLVKLIKEGKNFETIEEEIRAYLAKEGKNFETIEEEIRAYLAKSRLFFSFFSIHNLAQNGRVNKTAAGVLNVLNIGVYGTATSEGKIAMTGKARGEKKCLKALFDQMKEAGYEGGKAIITHTENEEAAQNLKDLVLSSYPDANIQIFPTRGLCSYYMERKGVVISCETR